MKTFKLLIASIVVSCFFFTANVNAQANVWLWDHPHTIDQPCIGEVIQGQMYMHFVENGKFVIANLSGEYIGLTSGNTYKVLGNWKWSKDLPWPTRDVSIRIIGDNGLVYMLHAVYKNDKLTIDGCK